jgi:hypothetical protein
MTAGDTNTARDTPPEPRFVFRSDERRTYIEIEGKWWLTLDGGAVVGNTEDSEILLKLTKAKP